MGKIVRHVLAVMTAFVALSRPYPTSAGEEQASAARFLMSKAAAPPRHNLAQIMEECGLKPDWKRARMFNAVEGQDSAIQLPVAEMQLGQGTADWTITPDNSNPAVLAWTVKPLNDRARIIQGVKPDRASVWMKCLADLRD